MANEFLMNLRGMTPEEYSYLQQVMSGMSERQVQSFVNFYSQRRRTPQDILLFTLIGFLGIAGIQRFLLGHMWMGILYILTVGLCFIGTIVDSITHRSLATEYNQKAAYESLQMVKMMS